MVPWAPSVVIPEHRAKGVLPLLNCAVQGILLARGNFWGKKKKSTQHYCMIQQFHFLLSNLEYKKTNSKRYKYTYIHYSAINNSHDLETTPSTQRPVSGSITRHVHNRVMLGCKKCLNLAFHKYLDETGALQSKVSQKEKTNIYWSHS